MSLTTILLLPLIVIAVLAIPAGLIVYLRYRGLPRYRVPVFPAHREEALRVHRHWQKYNRTATLLADVRLEDGSVLRDVGFDPDAMVAVQVDGSEVPVWFYRHPIVGALVLNDSTDEAEREAFAQQ